MKHHWECIFQRDPRNPLLEEEESLFRFNSMPYYVYSQDMILLFHSKERRRRRRREGSSFKEDLSIPSLLVLSCLFLFSYPYPSHPHLLSHPFCKNIIHVSKLLSLYMPLISFYPSSPVRLFSHSTPSSTSIPCCHFFLSSSCVLKT